MIGGADREYADNGSDFDGYYYGVGDNTGILGNTTDATSTSTKRLRVKKQKFPWDPPSYGEFGEPEFIDSLGREYRWDRKFAAIGGGWRTDDAYGRYDLVGRWPIKRRTKEERERGTPIGGGGGDGGPGAPQSLSGGMWNPKWPQPDDTIKLLRLGTNKLYRGRIFMIVAPTRSVTARIQLCAPGLEPYREY